MCEVRALSGLQVNGNETFRELAADTWMSASACVLYPSKTEAHPWLTVVSNGSCRNR